MAIAVLNISKNATVESSDSWLRTLKLNVTKQFILVIENGKLGYNNPITITITCNFNSNKSITIIFTWVNSI